MTPRCHTKELHCLLHTLHIIHQDAGVAHLLRVLTKADAEVTAVVVEVSCLIYNVG